MMILFIPSSNTHKHTHTHTHNHTHAHISRLSTQGREEYFSSLYSLCKMHFYFSWPADKLHMYIKFIEDNFSNLQAGLCPLNGSPLFSVSNTILKFSVYVSAGCSNLESLFYLTCHYQLLSQFLVYYILSISLSLQKELVRYEEIIFLMTT